jgi:hypothetical protein
VVDGSGLENRHTRKGIGGSNPSLSASTLVIYHLQAGDTYTDSTISEVVIDESRSKSHQKGPNTAWMAVLHGSSVG